LYQLVLFVVLGLLHTLVVQKLAMAEETAGLVTERLLAAVEAQGGMLEMAVTAEQMA
jgi:hypothetical protein